jgi:hypothetical protein
VTPEQEYVLSRIRVIAEGCWIWDGCLTRRGYGDLYWRRSRYRAHRFSYEAFCRPIPDGLHLDHLCKTKACINPVHLEPVTLLENLRRGDSPAFVNARKTHCVGGHAFTPENTRVTPSNERACRACDRERVRRQYYAARKVLPA